MQRAPNPLVSVVTVCRNAASTVRATAESVLAQTSRDFEWIVIDGASADATLTVLEPFRPHIAQLVSEPDHGIYDAMNKGLRLARGRYVHFLNADDRYANDTVLADVMQRMRASPTWPKLAYGKVDFVDTRHGFRERVTGRHGYWHFVRSCAPHHQGSFLEVAAARQLGGFNLNYGWSGDIGLIAAFKRSWPDGFFPMELVVAEFDMAGVSSHADWLMCRERQRAYAIARELGIRWGCLNLVHGVTIWGRSLLRLAFERLGWLAVWRRCKQRLNRERYSISKTP